MANKEVKHTLIIILAKANKLSYHDSMLELKLLNNLLSRLRVGAIRIIDWTGNSIVYGQGEPYLTVTIHNPKAIRALIRNLTMGFGESYMNGDIDVIGNPVNIGRIVSENQAAFTHPALNLLSRRLTPNRQSKQKHQIAHHYDIGNNFYKLWLDPSMTYSCAYFKTPNDTLEQAQVQKRDHVLKKLMLEPGMTLLDIGSGWGELLIAAFQQYGVKGYGVTLSEEQFKESTAKIRRLGLEDDITIELINYQELTSRPTTFDRIVSVGMFEHVGAGNHKTYFDVVEKLLNDGGITVLHTISNEVETPSDPWIDKYIFPGGYLPSVRETVAMFPSHNLRMIDYENLRIHYAMTLEIWLEQFDAYKNEVIALYDEKFYRMWRLYLAGSASGFRYDALSLSQYVMTKGLRNDLPLTREYLYLAV